MPWGPLVTMRAVVSPSWPLQSSKTDGAMGRSGAGTVCQCGSKGPGGSVSLLAMNPPECLNTFPRRDVLEESAYASLEVCRKAET